MNRTNIVVLVLAALVFLGGLTLIMTERTVLGIGVVVIAFAIGIAAWRIAIGFILIVIGAGIIALASGVA